MNTLDPRILRHRAGSLGDVSPVHHDEAMGQP
jgi:hypothetical protein